MINATQAAIPDLDEENTVSTKAGTAVESLIGADRAGVVCAQKFDEVRGSGLSRPQWRLSGERCGCGYGRVAVVDCTVVFILPG